MVSKKFRLGSSVDKRFKNSYATPLYLFLHMPNTLGHARIGVTISKKIDKRATVRNKIRRKIFSCFENKELLGKGVDMLFIAKKDIISATDICGTIEKTLYQIHIL